MNIDVDLSKIKDNDDGTVTVGDENVSITFDGSALLALLQPILNKELT